jgi:hypothetical protein
MPNTHLLIHQYASRAAISSACFQAIQGKASSRLKLKSRMTGTDFSMVVQSVLWLQISGKAMSGLSAYLQSTMTMCNVDSNDRRSEGPF